MLNLALVAVLSGSLLTGSPDGDKDKNKEQSSDAAPMMVVQTNETADARSITSDTFAAGRPADAAPIKLWVEYGYGEIEGTWDAAGNDAEIAVGCAAASEAACTLGDIVSQRLGVGVQLNVINFPSFKLGIGGELSAAQNKFQIGTAGPLITSDLESSFGLQNVKIFGTLRGRAVGLHGGYVLDVADDQEFQGAAIPGTNIFLPTTLTNSDGRDAIFFGGDFDYPAENVRLFGGVDYYMLQDADLPVGGGATETVDSAEDVLFFTLGAGFRVSFFELGAALNLRTQFQDGFGFIAARSHSGSHAGSVSPYLKVSPPSLPISLFVKGAVQNEYTDYGYALGGANDVKPSIGFTAGLTVGFE